MVGHPVQRVMFSSYKVLLFKDTFSVPFELLNENLFFNFVPKR